MESLAETSPLVPSYTGAPILPKHLTLVDDAVATAAKVSWPTVDEGTADESDDVEDMWDNVPV
ncbi:MAG: hypothetical protein AAGA06_06265 [Pseudomonadota bacterium]